MTDSREFVLLQDLLKELERQESDFPLKSDEEHCNLQTRASELEDILKKPEDNELLNSLDQCLHDSQENLNSAKRELANKLQAILQLKRQLDEVPSQAELIQYERRFSELYTHIQEKHRQTHKYYATFNALLEIKELMLKETSLLNSISSQFQDAITNPSGRKNLIDSMEGVLMGIQQKLGKVHLVLQSEQKVRDDLKSRHASTVSEKRKCYSLLRAFQEECARNERLLGQSS